MKKYSLLFLVLLLLCIGTFSIAEYQPCYWQLTAIETELAQKPFKGKATGSTSMEPISVTDPIKMMGLVSGSQSVRLDVQTTRNVSTLSPAEPVNASALYTISGIPVIVPGSARAQLTVSANTTADPHSFYLYANITANKKPVIHLRDTGSWVVRAAFPSQAEPGDTCKISLFAHEGNGLISQRLSYVYTAVSGYTLIDPAGNTVLYDGKGVETDRFSKTLKENLPSLISDVSGTEGVIFSSEQKDDGSVIAVFAPENGLSTNEIIDNLHALQENVQRIERKNQPAETASEEVSPNGT